MKDLTIILFERIGLLLVIAFVLTRTPGFKRLLDRNFNIGMTMVHAIVFGIFAIASTITGIVIDQTHVLHVDFIIFPVEDHQLIVSTSLVAVVIAGLLGGPVVGLGAGLIAGVHLIFLGGIGGLANGFVNPLTGLLAGLTARFFSNERVISPLKALFIGVFPPVLQMQLLLIFYTDAYDIVRVVDWVGLPLVLSNSVAIAIFTAMIGIVLKEQENEAALATKQGLTIAEEAIPYLKQDGSEGMAQGIADLLYDRLDLAAVSVTNHNEVLAHKGIGNHHQTEKRIRSKLAKEAIATKTMKVTYTKDELECPEANCPLQAAIMIPISKRDDEAGLIIFYFRKPQHISPVEITMAEGLGQFITNQLTMLHAEKLKMHMRDTELRNLQAQINPHFLFNTLQLIATLFREDAEKARHLTLKLAGFMRFNLRLVQKSLVELEKECEHVEAYTAIIQARFADRLTIHFERPEDLSDIYIPPSTIQPLVENCVNHGLHHKAKHGRIDIVVTVEASTVFILVRDNGDGFAEHILKDAGHKPLSKDKSGGIGIYNVNQRLISLLGESAKLTIQNLPAGGSEVYFQIPRLNQMERKAIP
ncbi:LytS/YhcK type 5TM receptor domain-containing protein [Oceanobacillus alkalisoli]|uniref:LytS/YhcK type 5TM receptor domain-containing protein n=1 Tax=Oceanobacillus alkalisoli TaxID=2925113 RepID=UPI001EE4559A|nr:LytS/YhcK type 5TM receptor domain-containing protein [Oceanobacillus alkalisoli]MCG5104936.1 histidine kinase [Oceanobacillus alkalisoli]